MLFKKATVKENALKKRKKMLKKQIFEQKSSCDIFKSMLDRNVRFFGGRNTSNGLTLKRLPDPQPTQRRKPPHLQSTPLASARQEISQHVGIFFRGGGNEVFFSFCPISSHVGIQIGRELVRLITLIGLNKFRTNITSPVSLKKFSRTTFR